LSTTTRTRWWTTPMSSSSLRTSRPGESSGVSAARPFNVALPSWGSDCVNTRWVPVVLGRWLESSQALAKARTTPVAARTAR